MPGTGPGSRVGQLSCPDPCSPVSSYRLGYRSGPGPDTGEGGEGLAPPQPPLHRHPSLWASFSLSGTPTPQPQPTVHVKSSPPIPVLSPHGQEGREGSWGSRTCAPSPLGGTQQVEAPPSSLAPGEHPRGHLLGLPPPLWACPSAPLPAQPPHRNPSSVPWCLWLKPHHQGRGGQPRVHPTTTPPRARQLPPVAVLSAEQVLLRPRSKAWLPGLWQQRAARLRKTSHHIPPGDLAWGLCPHPPWKRCWPAFGSLHTRAGPSQDSAHSLSLAEPHAGWEGAGPGPHAVSPAPPAAMQACHRP